MEQVTAQEMEAHIKSVGFYNIGKDPGACRGAIESLRKAGRTVGIGPRHQCSDGKWEQYVCYVDEHSETASREA